MTRRIVRPKKNLVFETNKVGDKTYCGVVNGDKNSIHKFVSERNGHGHDPGYVYLAYLPRGKYEGQYKIGKAEYTKVGKDDFDLDEIDEELLEALQKRLTDYHPGKGTDKKYDGAKFVHGIRVACGEGAEKQPQSFFTKTQKRVKCDLEVFNLTKADIETFKTATGSVLCRPIKHLTAENFADYLASKSMPDETIREWVILPDNKEKHH